MLGIFVSLCIRVAQFLLIEQIPEKPKLSPRRENRVEGNSEQWLRFFTLVELGKTLQPEDKSSLV